MVEIDTIVQEPVPGQREQLFDATVDRMLDLVDRGRSRSRRDGNGRTIAIAGPMIVLDPAMPSFERQLERLASAVEATIAYERAIAMLAAVGGQTGPVPLWLVSGSSVLAQWLGWSRSEIVLRRALRLSDQADTAPVAGTLDRTARVALGRTAMKIRVRNGLAVAGKIEIPAQQRCVMALGRTARLTIMDARLPATIIAALGGRGMAELSGQPFFTATDLVIKTARNEGQSLVVDLEHDLRPLAPVPEAALAVVPADADPPCPWRPTRREIAELYALVDTLRGHGGSPDLAVRRGPR